MELLGLVFSVRVIVAGQACPATSGLQLPILRYLLEKVQVEVVFNVRLSPTKVRVVSRHCVPSPVRVPAGRPGHH